MTAINAVISLGGVGLKKVLIVGLSKKVGGIETLFKGILGEVLEDIDVSIMTFYDTCAFEDLYTENGYTIYHLPSRRQRPVRFNGIIKKFFKEHRDFDYVWFNAASTSMYQIQYYAKKYTNAKVITHSHGTSFETNGKKLIPFANKVLGRLNRKKALGNTDLFFCCSKAAGLALFGKEYEKDLILIPNAIDSERFAYDEDNRREIREEFGVKDNELLIGIVGRLSQVKNPIKSLEIFCEVLKKRPDAKFIAVGHGELRTDMEQYINEKGIAGSVIFAGLRHDVYKIVSALDILLMPSLFEGLPLTAIEAQCAGVRCVLSDTITKEVAISDIVSYESLDSSAEVWAESILSNDGEIERASYRSKIIDSGYDINSTRNLVRGIING